MVRSGPRKGAMTETAQEPTLWAQISIFYIAAPTGPIEGHWPAPPPPKCPSRLPDAARRQFFHFCTGPQPTTARGHASRSKIINYAPAALIAAKHRQFRGVESQTPAPCRLQTHSGRCPTKFHLRPRTEHACEPAQQINLRFLQRAEDAADGETQPPVPIGAMYSS